MKLCEKKFAANVHHKMKKIKAKWMRGFSFPSYFRVSPKYSNSRRLLCENWEKIPEYQPAEKKDKSHFFNLEDH